MTETTFAVGDRVRIKPDAGILSGCKGTVTGYAKSFLGMSVGIDGQDQTWDFHATELERIDGSPAIAIKVGDPVSTAPWVRFLPGFVGDVVRIDDDPTTPCPVLVRFAGGTPGYYRHDEVRHIDDPWPENDHAEVDGDLAGTSMAGPADDDSGRTGTADHEKAPEEASADPAIAPEDQLAALTARVARIELLDLIQDHVNVALSNALDELKASIKPATDPVRAMTVTAGDAELQDSLTQAFTLIHRTGGEVVDTQLTSVVIKGDWEVARHTVLITYRERT